VLRSHKIAHDVKDKIRDAIPAVSDVLVHIEPLGIAARKRGMEPPTSNSDKSRAGIQHPTSN
jgi:divalent metal cation (Fe/Co/Zn/Cd) transporter